MGEIKLKEGAVLIAGLLFRCREDRESLVREMERIWGPVESASAVIPFDFTNYYAGEIGPDLRRQFIAFDPPFRAETLREAKIASNEIEATLSVGGKRTVNIDPGCLDLSKLIVASTKDATYRVYLGGGIYAQPMLRYERGCYRPWPWTYPDYRDEAALSFFGRVRESNKKRRM